MFRVKLPVKLDEERYGIRFLDGVGECDNESVALKLKAKGFEVTEIEAASEAALADEPAKKSAAKRGRPKKEGE